MRHTTVSIYAVLACSVVTHAFSEPPANDVARAFAKLAERHDNDPSAHQPAIDTLIDHGIESLTFLYAKFDQIDDMARFEFQNSVIPKLPPVETSAILLKEFLEGAPVLDEANRIFERIEVEGETLEFEAAFAKIERRYDRIRWTTGAIGKLGYSDGYDLLYPHYQRHRDLRNIHSALAHALYAIDPGRAVEDIMPLVGAADAATRLKGITSLRQMGVRPPCPLLARLVDDSDKRVRNEARQFIYRLDMQYLDLLIELSTHKDKHVRESAEYGLTALAHLPKEHVKELMAAKDSTATAADVWRKWWADGKLISEDELRRNGLALGLKIAENHVSVDMVHFLSGFASDPRVFPVLARALNSTDPTLKSAALRAVSQMTWSGEPHVTALFLDYCERCPAAEFIQIRQTLMRMADPRVGQILLRMLAKDLGTNELLPTLILDAIAERGDQQAIEPVTKWLQEHRDSSQHAAAKALAKLAGPESVQPLLLTRLIEEPDHNVRAALCATMKSIGGTSLAAELTRALPLLDGNDATWESPRKDVLMLMEAFPDPAAKPLLRELLKSDSGCARLYAARVLGKLGDNSGVPVILEDLFAPQTVPVHRHTFEVGRAMKDIGAPGTRERLEALYRRTQGDDRGRVLEVIERQGDIAFLPFLDELLNKSTEPAEVHGAAFVITSLIENVSGQDRSKPLDLSETNLAAVKVLLRYALHGEPPTALDGEFPDQEQLAKQKGAVLASGDFAYLHYSTDDESLRVLNLGDPKDRELIDRSKQVLDDTIADGTVNGAVYGDYLVLAIGIDSGGITYLFHMKNGRWAPVCRTFGWIK